MFVCFGCPAQSHSLNKYILFLVIDVYVLFMYYCFMDQHISVKYFIHKKIVLKRLNGLNFIEKLFMYYLTFIYIYPYNLWGGGALKTRIAFDAHLDPLGVKI